MTAPRAGPAGLCGFAVPAVLHGDRNGAFRKRGRLGRLRRPRAAGRMCMDSGRFRAASAEELESVVLAGLVGKEGGRRMSDDDRARLRLLADCLGECESTVPVQWPERLDVLDGAPWNLVYSSEPLPPLNVLPLPLPLSTLRIAGIQQRFATSERKVENVILLAADWPYRRSGGGADAEVVVNNTFDVRAPDTVALSLESAELRVRGLGEQRMRSFLPPLAVGRLAQAAGGVAGRGGRGGAQSAEVRTTFIGRILRVADSPGGELRIFSRTLF